MLGFDLLTAAGLLVLAGNVVQCNVPQAPFISINPTSAPIQYDYTLSSKELGVFKSDTISPYAPGADTTTGGLRHDRPAMHTEVTWGVRKYPDRQIACLWYEKITIDIALEPKIYIAKEEKRNPACRDAIMDHELKHVSVDREVINRYAAEIGQAVKQAVDGAGAMGPYKYEDLADIQARLVDHVKAAVDSRKLMLYQEMSRLQGQVDSLEEYERVSKICRKGR